MDEIGQVLGQIAGSGAHDVNRYGICPYKNRARLKPGDASRLAVSLVQLRQKWEQTPHKPAMARQIAVALFTATLAPATSCVFARAQPAAGCTASSFTIPSWLVEDFESHSPAGSTVVSFHALNRATNSSSQFRCPHAPVGSATEWRACSARNQTGSEQPLTVSFRADETAASFRFNETWTCSDMTPAKPYGCLSPSLHK